MDAFQSNNIEIILNKKGSSRYTKTSYPVRYGRFCEIKTTEYLFGYNLNGEIKTIRGIGPNWPHPAEWLKRTDANDWVFYTVGRYHRLFSFLGEYYLPCLSYPSNPLWEYNPFSDPSIQEALAARSRLEADLVATAKYRNDEDLIGQFIGECCLLASTYKEQADPLYQAYRKWCEFNGYLPLGSRKFGEKMRERFERVVETKSRFYKGI